MIETEAKLQRLLCITPSMNGGGGENFLIKVYRQLDRTQYQMDFCIGNEEYNFYEEEIHFLGGKIYHLPLKDKHPLRYFYRLFKLLRKHRYTYVLCLGNTAFSTAELWLAWLCGVKVRALRSCGSEQNYSPRMVFWHRKFRKLLLSVVNVRIALSDVAAEFTFGNQQVQLLPNGLEVDRFAFSKELRARMRREIRVENHFVVGHIGRFAPSQNHAFVLQVFAEIKKLRPDAVLCLVGKGKLKDSIKAQSVQMNLRSSINFFSVHVEIPDMLDAMDVMIFPSLFEGVSNTVISAQAAGLPCLVSDAITRHIRQNDWVHFMSLKSPAAQWAKEALKLARDPALTNREEAARQIYRAGLDIGSIAQEFTKIIFQTEKK